MKRGERPNIEFKGIEFIRENNNKKIAKTLASIANLEGGHLLIGVTDSGDFEGIEFDKNHEEKIMQIAVNSCQPSIDIEFSIVNFNEGDIYHIKIPKAIDQPIKTIDGWFIRHGTITRIMEYRDFKKFIILENTSVSEENENLDVNDILLNETKKNILIQNGKVIPYLESKNSKGLAECTIYANTYNQFYEKAYKLEITFSHLSLNDLKNIIKNYYSIFQYEHHISAFGINQETYSWFGYGPLNFIEALEMQDFRYASLKKNNEYIHHSEAACFIDEVNESIFYIHLQPNKKVEPNKSVTLSYVNIGILFNKIPYGKKYYEFFEKIGRQPDFIDEINYKLTESKNIQSSFKEEGFIIDNPEMKFGGWVTGVFGNNFKNNNITDVYHDKIIVNFGKLHEVDDKCEYNILSARVTDLPAGAFPVKIVNYRGEWTTS
ncbi:MAG: ATP-binding protein [Spirochaetes bacterium]|nr:ATP-binding protein [Spirochaetota bacterium]